MEKKKVGIIGAGISGLIACKYALSKGFSPIVFESESSIGGVWAKTIETTLLQTPKVFYQFSDFPWPSSVTTDFPDQHQTYDYIHSYALHFDLLRHINLGSKVVGIEYQGPGNEEMRDWTLWGGTGHPFNSKGTWKLTVEHNLTHSTQVHYREVIAEEEKFERDRTYHGALRGRTGHGGERRDERVIIYPHKW